MGDPVHIALTFDDGFWAPAYATMRSIGLSSRRRGDLVFHLFHRGLSVAHRTHLDEIPKEFGARLIDYDLSANTALSAFLADLSAHRVYTTVIYARLMLHELLPADIARVVYLDCDMLVRAPIEALAELDLKGKPVVDVWGFLKNANVVS